VNWKETLISICNAKQWIL